MLNIKFPIIGAPMFLVSNVEMVVSISEAGGIGTFPALNFRPIDEYKKKIIEIKQKTKKPIGINVIVNKSNKRQNEDIQIAMDSGVELIITSLGSPKEVIKVAHQNGAKVLCDVTNLEYAKKVQDMGADGVIAVSSGAGGHAGPTSPFILIPWLKKELEIPVISAGGVADGRTFLAALVLGADGVSVGTRFIASTEAKVDSSYKEAILKSTPDDIVMSTRISGTPASVIKTPYLDKIGYELPWYLDLMKNNSQLKKYIVPLIHLMGSKSLEKSIVGPTWKTVWSAGQTVGLINEIKPCAQIIHEMVDEYYKVKSEIL